MNIVVIGPGALGSLFAARLAMAGHPITLLDHNPARARAMANRLILSSADKTFEIPLTTTAAPACLRDAELVLVAVKSAQVADLLALIRQNTGTDSLIIGLQNGIAHLRFFADSQAGLALGVTAQGATLLKPGHVRHGGDGPTFLGFLQSVPPRQNALLARSTAVLCAAGLAAQVVDDIENRLWQKLLINAGINGLTVLYNCANGKLLEIPEARRRLQALVEEGALVARALGIDVGSDPVKRCLEVCRSTAPNISSMLQDVRNQRPTEIMAINGVLVSEARKLTILTPENELLIKEIVLAQGS